MKKEPLSLRYFPTLIATWFGSGLLPRMPGTWGSIAAFPFWYFGLRHLSWMESLIIILAVFILGTFVSYKVLQKTDSQDPSYIVIDEVVGLWIALFFIKTFALGLCGFFLFRFFDISKIEPVGFCEGLGDPHNTLLPLPLKKRQALSIMLDDVMAGIMAACSLFLFSLLASYLFGLLNRSCCF